MPVRAVPGPRRHPAALAAVGVCPVKAVLLIVAALLVLAHPAVAITILAAELSVLGVLSVLIIRAARGRVYPCPRRA